MIMRHSVLGLAKRLSSVRMASSFADVPMGPPDAILGLNDAFNKDPATTKVNLSVGAYRCDDGKPYVLPSVRAAEQKVLDARMNHEYSTIIGNADFVASSLKFAYGEDCEVLKSGRIAGTQTLSGTGACRLAGEFYSRFHPGAAMYLPNPTWGNHIPIMKDAGMEVKKYRYYDPATGGLDFQGLMEDVAEAKEGSVFLLHACAHNPTGVDPSLEQWAQISAEMKRKGHLVFFDCAYQGFASGDADKDAAAVRMFLADGHEVALAQSFAKNFGLYGERVGCFSVACEDSDTAARVLSQLKIIIRPMYSNPPLFGARLVQAVLSDPALKAQWYEECSGMASRIISMRHALRNSLEGLGSSHDWSHVTSQIGMFCFSGLTKEEVLKIRSDYHVYLTGDGRISMAGVSTNNVEYLANAIHDVTK